MPSNADYTREYFQIIDELDGDIESRRAAFNYMQDSTAIVHHQVVASSFVPRLFNRKTYEVMKRTAETSHRILCKQPGAAGGDHHRIHHDVLRFIIGKPFCNDPDQLP